MSSGTGVSAAMATAALDVADDLLARDLQVRCALHAEVLTDALSPTFRARARTIIDDTAVRRSALARLLDVVVLVRLALDEQKHENAQLQHRIHTMTTTMRNVQSQLMELRREVGWMPPTPSQLE